jgi:hypothetical protein
MNVDTRPSRTSHFPRALKALHYHVHPTINWLEDRREIEDVINVVFRHGPKLGPSRLAPGGNKRLFCLAIKVSDHFVREKAIEAPAQN